MTGIFGLQRSDERFELRERTQIRETRILEEERPAGEAGVYGSLEPFEGGVEAAEESVNARYLIVGVMSVAKGFGIGTGARHAAESLLRIPGKSVKNTLHADDHRVIRNERGRFIEQDFCALIIAHEHGGLRREVDGVFVGGIFGTPKSDLTASEIVFALPHVRLHDAVADGFAWIEGTAALVHREGVIEQTDVREDGAETIVSVR